ncbi:Prolyl endopeptidase, partial [Trichinella sp. T9]
LNLTLKNQFSNMFDKPVHDYPLARRDEQIQDDYHGTIIKDPYRWLENPYSTETQTFLCNPESLFAKIRQRILYYENYPKYGCYRIAGDYYFYLYNSGLEQHNRLYITNDWKVPGKLFTDVNENDTEFTTSMKMFSASKDGTLLAFGVTQKGSDWTTVKFRKIPSGELLDDKLENLRYTSLVWSSDAKGIFYTTFANSVAEAVGTCPDKNEFHTLYYHVLGTDQKDDLVVLRFPLNPILMMYFFEHYVFSDAAMSDNEQFLLCTIYEGCSTQTFLYLCDMTTDQAKAGNFEMKYLDLKAKAKYEFVGVYDSCLIFVTDDNAPMHKLIKVDIQKNNEITTILEEVKSKRIGFARIVNHKFLLVDYIENVKDVMYIYDLQTAKQIGTLDLPFCTVSSISSRQYLNEFFLKCSSFSLAGMIMHYKINDDGTYVKTIVHSHEFSENMQVKQIFYDSKDGTKVPMYIVSKKDMQLNGQNPTILYGYGGFKIALMPSFSVSTMLFVNDFGGVFAIANTRGGGEFGKAWHSAGLKNNRQNVFDDFIAAAEYLISLNYTRPSLLAIQGGSCGGMMVAACANQRPDLFGCLIAQVGVMDMLRFQNFTIGRAWTVEFGCSECKEEFEYLVKFSPLHNIRSPLAPVQYPATLLFTADHDDRVVPCHSLKFMAELYYQLKDCAHQTNPLLIHIDTDSGHNFNSMSAQKRINEIVKILIFIAKVMNLSFNV